MKFERLTPARRRQLRSAADVLSATSFAAAANSLDNVLDPPPVSVANVSFLIFNVAASALSAVAEQDVQELRKKKPHPHALDAAWLALRTTTKNKRPATCGN